MIAVKAGAQLRSCASLRSLARCAHAAVQESAAAAAALRAHKPTLSKLPNGVLVASWETYSPVSRVVVVARGGARYESSELVGASHFLRRAIGVVGTKHFTAYGLTRSTQQMGATLTASSTREHLLLGIDVIRDFAGDAAERLANVATRTQFDRHWEVEEALKYVEADHVVFEQHAEARLVEALHDAAYRSSLRRSIYSAPYRARENLEAHEFIEAFYSHTFGAPSNVALVATGVNHEDAEAFAAKLYFEDSASKAHKHHGAIKKDTPKFGGGERRVDTGDDHTHMAIVSEAAGYTDLKGSLAFATLAKAVGGVYSVKRSSNAASNRLGVALSRAGLREAHYVAPLSLQHSDSGLFGFYVVANANEAGNAIRAVRAEFVQALKGGVSAEDLKRAKAQLHAELALDAETSCSWLRRAAASVVETGKLPATGEEVAAEIERLSVDDVNAAARRVLNGKTAYAVVGGIEHAPTIDEL